MFSSALKSFTSNITSNYEISKQPTATPGIWRIFDGKKKSTGQQASIFIFDRKALDPNTGGFGSRASASAVKKVQDQVVERLKREASNLARLRHPSILQLVEPVEDTRTGGLMFATEPITASLAGLLAEKDEQERSGGVGGRPSRYVVEDPDGTRRRRDVEMDDLEIQKGLLQIAKGLEFLHESAKLVHANLTPDAIYVNSKSDWKIAGLAFAGPPDTAEGHQTLPKLALSELLYHDPRLPRSVQLNLDYTSPDFVLDTNVTTSADIYSLGLITVALYSFPHVSPLQTSGNQSAYKKLMGSSSTTPGPSNSFLSSRPLPKELSQTLPRLLARRPAQRMTAREFQESAYFDNLLMNTIRFLDAFPAKTPNEKSQFMRGLGRVMPQFPPSVLGKKVLGVLLDEMKDHELLSLILQNVFAIIKIIPFRRVAFQEKVIPKLRETFLTKSQTLDRDAGKEAGLMVILENMELATEHCSAKEFKDDILPIVLLAMDSSTHSLVDKSLQSLSTILPVLDFTTVKHDLFPVVAGVVSKTSSLGIKVSGLEALVVLCGGTVESADGDDELSGVLSADPKKTSGSGTALDKFTVQEKVVPLLKAIKTKEPAVMMAALSVFKSVGKVADIDFLAIEVIPTLWAFSLGPLLNLQQFKAFMDLIKTLSTKIEIEQIRKLQELSSSNRSTDSRSQPNSNMSNGLHSTNGTPGGNTEEDFERLVLGKKAGSSTSNDIFGDSSSTASTSHTQSTSSTTTIATPAFSWSSSNTVLQPQSTSSRSITPDNQNLSPFPSLRPSNMAPPPTSNPSSSLFTQQLQQPSSSAFAWSTPSTTTTPNPLSSLQNRPLQPQPPTSTAFSIPPPPSSPWATTTTTTPPSQTGMTSPPPPSLSQTPNYNIPHRQQQQQQQFPSMTPMIPLQSPRPPPPQGPMLTGHNQPLQQPQQQQQQGQKMGLDKYASLL